MLELSKTEALFTTRWLGRSSNELHKIIDSTNNRAMELARNGGNHGTIIIATEQTAGRGRNGRDWFSPGGSGLYISFLIRPKTQLANLSAVTLITGVATAQAIQKCLNIQPGLKWVNDLILDGKKIGGILCEYQDHSSAARRGEIYPPVRSDVRHQIVGADVISPGSRVDAIDPYEIERCANDKTTVKEEPVGAKLASPCSALIIGIGLNLHEPNNLPADLNQKIGFLDSHLPTDQSSIDPNLLIATITNELESALDQMQAGNLSSLLDQWRAYSITLGEEIVAHMGDKQITGQALDINDTGELIIKTNGGNITISGGEVSIRKATGSYI